MRCPGYTVEEVVGGRWCHCVLRIAWVEMSGGGSRYAIEILTVWLMDMVIDLRKVLQHLL